MVLALTLHGGLPNQVIHFDYLILGTILDGNMDVLLVKDDISGYCWLEPTVHATADHTATVLALWIRMFKPQSSGSPINVLISLTM